MCQITDLNDYRRTHPPAARAMVAGYRVWLTGFEICMASWVQFNRIAASGFLHGNRLF